MVAIYIPKSFNLIEDVEGRSRDRRDVLQGGEGGRAGQDVESEQFDCVVCVICDEWRHGLRYVMVWSLM